MVQAKPKMAGYTTAKGKSKSHQNRGMALEKKIENQCKKYMESGIASIYKMPTDWVVVRAGKKIVSAFPKKKSIADFIGSYDGRAISIETKTTQINTSFALSLIAEHQYDFFDEWCKHSMGYYIIWFKKLNEMYLVEAMKLKECKDNLTRKSIPYDWFSENATLMENTDFLKYIDKH